VGLPESGGCTPIPLARTPCASMVYRWTQVDQYCSDQYCRAVLERLLFVAVATKIGLGQILHDTFTLADPEKSRGLVNNLRRMPNCYIGLRRGIADSVKIPKSSLRWQQGPINDVLNWLMVEPKNPSLVLEKPRILLNVSQGFQQV